MLFGQSYQIDLFSQVFKVLLAMGLFLVVCICGDVKGVAERHHPEFYLLLFTCTLAMMLLTSTVHLLSIYVALELSSYSLYVLVALRRTRELAVAAALKFFIVGIVSSAVMLFGLALLYGSTGAVYLNELARALPAAADQPLVQIGLLLTLCGFFFKLAVFPFHIWAPDTYQARRPPGHGLHRHGLEDRGDRHPGAHGLRRAAAAPISCMCWWRSVDSVHDRRQPRCHRPERPEAALRLFQHRPGRLCPDRHPEHERPRATRPPFFILWRCW